MTTKPQCNIGIRPLGRGPIVSSVVLAEIAEQKARVRDYAALEPVHSPERARAHRAVLARSMPSVVPILRELGFAD